MTSIKLKFRSSSVQGKDGVLFFQIIHNRVLRRIATGFHIYDYEWDAESEAIIIPEARHPRYDRLSAIQREVQWNINRFDHIAEGMATATVDELVATFQGQTEDGNGVFDYLRKQSERLKNLNRARCSETMMCTLRSFMRFRGYIDMSFSRLDKDVIEQYEAYLKAKGVKRNTSSFYMRIFRTAYKQAVEDGLTDDNKLFRRVYTGVDKTVKRAISLDDIKKIKSLDVSNRPALDFAKDMLLFSFYARGMSFVDMAYLRKKDMDNGFIHYRRQKTDQALIIEVVRQMQDIISKYTNTSQYLLPIIKQEDGTERRQYQKCLTNVNRNLKKIGEMVGLSIPLSTYVSRHSWATIAREKNVPLAVISEGLGHDSEATTQIYLDSIRSAAVDKANRLILEDL